MSATLPFSSELWGATTAQPGSFHFPQGLASGDPTPHSVMLWTRVERLGGPTAQPIALVLQVATDAEFTTVVAERTVIATEASDHTVRVYVEDLAPDTIYYYRFRASADVTHLLGRTRTAPAPDSDRAIHLAFASCQSYEGGYYDAWRTLVNEDLAAPADQQLDFVLHLGDFIYEALGYGGTRNIDGLPSGGGTPPEWAGGVYALTLADYRFLYKTYLSDPDLQAARARWPFINTWDDHEFSDDCWQSASTYTSKPQAEQRRKVAANQAWFEFIPAVLSELPASTAVANEARDFTFAAVDDAPLSGQVDAHGLDTEANNLRAIDTLSIYRSFRFGRHVELVVTDTRSHRSEHPIPGELNQQISGSARYVTPWELIKIFDAGRTFAGGHPPAEIPLGDKTIPNVRRNSPAGTMLGAAQKAWFKEVLRHTDATWKLWGNSLPLQPLRLDFHHLDPAKGAELAFTTDCWDGYPSERAELLNFVADHGINNFVSLTGDHHCHFAGAVTPDFDADSPRWVGAEFAVAGISSQSLFQGVLSYTKPDNPLRPLTAFDTPDGLAENLNTSFLWGTKAAMTAAKTGGSLEAAKAARNPRQNRHLAYCDTHSYGVSRARVTADAIEVEHLAIVPPLEARGDQGAELLRRVRFHLPAWAAGEPAPKLGEPTFEGPKPYPLA